MCGAPRYGIVAEGLMQVQGTGAANTFGRRHLWKAGSQAQVKFSTDM
jgi:hypothetical protein